MNEKWRSLYGSSKDKAPFIASLIGSRTEATVWLKRPKPFQCEPDSASDAFRGMFYIAGIGRASEAARALEGVCGKSTAYKAWNNPTTLTWGKFDAMAQAAFGVYEESEAAKDDRILSANPWSEEQTFSSFIAAMESCARCSCAAEIDSASRRRELDGIAEIAEKLSDEHLYMLRETAHAFLMAETAQRQK